nr:FtsX-like permease family protein [Parahaliea mediterranea]
MTVGAMVFCNALLVFLIAVQLDSYRMMIDNTLGAFTGHLQVQRAGYHEDQRMQQTVPAVAALADKVRRQPGVSAAAGRAMAYALASSEQRSFGILVTGVQPDAEPSVSTYPGLVSAGRYLDGSEAAEIVIGAVLARNLKLGLGDELTFLGSGRDGGIAAGVATVVGIVDSGIAEVDRGVAQIPLGYFQQTFFMGDSGHSVVARVDELDHTDAVVASLRRQLAADSELVVLDWDTLQPGLREAIQTDMISAWFMYAVLIVLVALSVLNTQLMSVLERTREFGVMLALGMRPGRLGRLVMLETLLMATLGLALGALVGAAVVYYFSVFGFSYPGMAEAAAKFNLPPRLYPQVSALAVFWGPVTVFAGALLASLYPALKLLRMEPVAAMRAV